MPSHRLRTRLPRIAAAALLPLAAPGGRGRRARDGRTARRAAAARAVARRRLHRLLAETALIYLDRGGRADLTATAVHVHPNTVKHRLRRLAELTPFGEPPPEGEELDHAFRWRWALASWLDQAGTTGADRPAGT